ncbi:hypothetical protein [Nocardia otitidiscaviarum]|uniref:Uncharacterized protein n=1 Tax=Nocardia otitidiscaviarum TaxID=1823 RepID=A0A516NJW1_9NOCA|nr:hypothetical protein [Nocardia otitidiscaviarum]MBF6180207.1 hypothetical protein [Nocardia otitidiscaviarum]MCP9620546.1 hypothetical protein [Nocardia otitidiscaviarum]QDP79191.1 hypothetical protein FOH10_11070 [Nocardia otitidiscaviarum]
MSAEQLFELIDRAPPDISRTEWWTNNPRHAYARAWLSAEFRIASQLPENGDGDSSAASDKCGVVRNV